MNILVNRTNTRYSAMHPCSKHTVFLDGTTWQTVIHYFYARQIKDSRLAYQVLRAKTVDDAFAIVVAADEKARAEWTPSRAREVLCVAYTGKVMQHSKVRSALLRTGSASIQIDLSGQGRWTQEPPFSDGVLLAEILVGIRDELNKDGPYDELKEPMLPPWLKYSDMHPYEMGWRMGDGEDYLCRFITWRQGLSPEGRKKYREMYPPPKGWR